MQNNQDLPQFGFLPNQYPNEFLLDFGGDWVTFNCDWTSPFLDDNGVDFDWMGQPLASFDMPLWPGFSTQSFPDISSMNSFWNENQLSSAIMPSPTHQENISDSSQFSPPLSGTQTPSQTSMSTSESCNPSPFLSSPISQKPSPSPPTLPKLSVCSTCQPNRTFPTPQILKRHQKTHSKPIPCQSPTCTKSFAEKRDMRRHVSVHHPALVPPQLYFCPEIRCNYSTKGFRRKDHLLRHMKNIHRRSVP